MDDDHMTIDSVPSPRAHPPPTTEIFINPKRHRRNPSAPTLLQNLPVEAVTSIIRYLHLHPPSPSDPNPTTSIRPLVHLRLVNQLFRNAFDAHILSLDLRDLPLHSLSSFLTTMLPRFHSLVCLSLPASALSPSILDQWKYFFSKSRARLQHIIFAHPTSNDHPTPVIEAVIPSILARHYVHSLERITTNSDNFLYAVGSTIGSAPNNIRNLQLQMDDISESRLICFKSLTWLKILYRKTLSLERAQSLVQVVQACKNADIRVHLRLNQLGSSSFTFLPHMPGLSKVSFFDGVIQDTNRGMSDLSSCLKLEQIQFEWVRDLSGQDIVALAQVMGQRLKKLVIWNCDEVGDEGLIGLAKYCPNAEVELHFGRDQFSQQALASLGDRVSWGTTN